MRTGWTLPLLLLSATASLAATPPPSGGFVALVQVTSDLNRPVGVTNAGDGSGRLFVVEQAGRIRIFDGFRVLATPFLDVTSLVSCCGERGLLGLAFHPDYVHKGTFFVYYTRGNGDIVLARYKVSGSDPNVADATSGTVLLTIGHSAQANHNGGQIAFGPDGFLYIAVGDGGGGGDPFESGQSLNTHLGKILRLDVDNGVPYGIPASNPFAGSRTAFAEIWDYGLRNPWRFSFDRATGDLYIGDVGQALWEEIDFEPASSGGGVNYGWDCREGAHDYDALNGEPNSGCAGLVTVDPVLEYGHGPECSITGGFVYRGPVKSFITGQYLYSDYCTGDIWHASRGTGGVWTTQKLPVPGNPGISSFGEGENGRIYTAYLPFGSATSANTLYWLAPYSFQDVPPTHWAWSYIEALLAGGITLGCDTTPRFCPDLSATRTDMAVLLVRAIHGGTFVPPSATGVFADVPPSHPAAAYIEQLYADGITKGCATAPLRYCPDNSLTRAEVAPYLLRVRKGSSYDPPAVTSTSFADVAPDFWAARWIEGTFVEGITTGCALSPRRYCPDNVVSRAEVAGFIARTFNLPRP